MSLASEGIKDILVDASVGVFNTTSGWSITIGELPPDPDTCMTIYDTGGRSPNPKWLLDYPSVQVMIRGGVSGYVAAETKAKQVKDVLLGFQSQDLNGDRWVSITMPGDVAFVGYDENKRPMFSANFRLIIEPAASVDTNRTAL